MQNSMRPVNLTLNRFGICCIRLLSVLHWATLVWGGVVKKKKKRKRTECSRCWRVLWIKIELTVETISGLGSFEGYEGKCSRGKWSEIQNISFCDKNPTKHEAGEGKERY